MHRLCICSVIRFEPELAPLINNANSAILLLRTPGDTTSTWHRCFFFIVVLSVGHLEPTARETWYSSDPSGITYVLLAATARGFFGLVAKENVGLCAPFEGLLTIPMYGQTHSNNRSPPVHRHVNPIGLSRAFWARVFYGILHAKRASTAQWRALSAENTLQIVRCRLAWRGRF